MKGLMLYQCNMKAVLDIIEQQKNEQLTIEQLAAATCFQVAVL